MRCFRADLHLHTCLSPCTELEMTPEAIVETAVARGLDVIGICDHNSAENVRALTAAAARSAPREPGGERIAVLGGMEVTTQEEVHVLGLFDAADGDRLEALQQLVYDNLPGRNDEVAFGDQLVCGEDGSFAESNERLLIGATTLGIEGVVEAIHDLGGLAVASHVDREGFGIIGQLGFVPDGLGLDALEISPRAGDREQWDALSRETGLPLVASSDAHRLSEIGAVSTSFTMESACVDEIRKALGSRDGRGVAV